MKKTFDTLDKVFSRISVDFMFYNTVFIGKIGNFLHTPDFHKVFSGQKGKEKINVEIGKIFVPIEARISDFKDLLDILIYETSSRQNINNVFVSTKKNLERQTNVFLESSKKTVQKHVERLLQKKDHLGGFTYLIFRFESEFLEIYTKGEPLRAINSYQIRALIENACCNDDLDDPKIIQRQPEILLDNFELKFEEIINKHTQAYDNESNEVEKLAEELRKTWNKITNSVGREMIETDSVQKYNEDVWITVIKSCEERDQQQKIQQQKTFEADQQSIKKQNEPSFFSKLFAFFFFYNCPNCNNMSGVGIGEKEETISVYWDNKDNCNRRISKRSSLIKCNKCGYQWIKSYEANNRI